MDEEQICCAPWEVDGALPENGDHTIYISKFVTFKSNGLENDYRVKLSHKLYLVDVNVKDNKYYFTETV